MQALTFRSAIHLHPWKNLKPRFENRALRRRSQAFFCHHVWKASEGFRRLQKTREFVLKLTLIWIWFSDRFFRLNSWIEMVSFVLSRSDRDLILSHLHRSEFDPTKSNRLWALYSQSMKWRSACRTIAIRSLSCWYKTSWRRPRDPTKRRAPRETKSRSRGVRREPRETNESTESKADETSTAERESGYGKWCYCRCQSDRSNARCCSRSNPRRMVSRNRVDYWALESVQILSRFSFSVCQYIKRVKSIIKASISVFLFHLNLRLRSFQPSLPMCFGHASVS